MDLREEAAHIPGIMTGCLNLEPEEIRTLYHLLYKLLDLAQSGR